MDVDPRLAATQRHPSTSTPSSLDTQLSQAHTDGHSSSPHGLSSAAGASAINAVPSAAAGTAADGDAAHDDPLADLKRPRACEACRQLKVRCDPEPDHPAGSCKRCAKANRRCVVTAPTRKRQKKSDSRVAELEKRIDSLTASLQASRTRSRTSGGVAASSGLGVPEPPAQDGGSGGGGGGVGRTSAAWLGQASSHNDGMGAGRPDDSITAADAADTAMAGHKRQASGDLLRRNFGHMPLFAPSAGNLINNSTEAQQGPGNSGSGAASGAPWPALCDIAPKGHSEGEQPDVIDRGVIDVETANEAFSCFTESFAPLLPFVVFPEETTMADIRCEKPILFLAILSVSIIGFRPVLQMPLMNELHRVFADRILIRGGKSLELVQALMVATMWYAPPDHFEELKFNQFLHLAIVTAMELGMNRRSPAKGKPVGKWRDIVSRKVPHVHPECLEARRIWLGCYFMSTVSSMSLRRPMLTRWNAYMDESIQMLQDSPDALPSDMAVIYWVKLAHLTEEITFQFSMDDPVTNVSITDPKTQYVLKGFERQLADWRKEVPANVYSPLMRHFASVTNIYLHEIALHIDHNIDDFKPPFISDLGTEEGKVDMGTATHVDALTSCLSSIHETYEVLCSIDPTKYHFFPSFHFVRTSYATVAFIRLHNAATAPGSKLGEVFRPSDLQIEYYLDKVVQYLKLSAEREAGRVVSRFAVIMSMLRTWFLKRKDGRNTFQLPHFFQLKDDCRRQHESEADAAAPDISGSSQTQNATASGPTSLRVLSEVALTRPDDSQGEGQPEPATSASGSSDVPPNLNTVTGNRPISLAMDVSPSYSSANIPSNESWSQLVAHQPFNASLAAQSTPAAQTFLERQQAYAQQQELIQASQFAEQDQAMPLQQQQLQQQQVEDFMAELDMVAFQPDGLAGLGNIWDDMFWQFPGRGFEGTL